MGREPPHRSSLPKARRRSPRQRLRSTGDTHPELAVRFERVIDGRFELVERAGSGSEGETWRALDLTNGTTVAIKLNTAHDFGEAASTSADALYSPNLPQLLAHGRSASGRRYQVTNWLAGDDLAQLLARGPLSAGFVAWVGCHVARGLAALHAICEVHGDVRPKNIRLVRHGGEFSNAVILDRLAPGQRGNLRTESPECAASGRATEASDLYALGCVLHWAITGTPPFDGEPAGVVALHRYAPRPALPDSVPGALSRLVIQLMDVDPDARPPSAAGVAELLGWIADDFSSNRDGVALARVPPLPWPQSPLSFGGALMCGREREKQWLAQRTLDSTDAPAVLCVRGPAGIGVSRLLRWLVEEAYSRGISASFGAIADSGSDVGGPIRSIDTQVEAEVAIERQARSQAEVLIGRVGLWVLDDAQALAPPDLAAAVRAVQIATAKGVRVVLVLGWIAGPSAEKPPRPNTQVHWNPENMLDLAPLDVGAVASWAERVRPGSLPADVQVATGGVPGQLVEWAKAQSRQVQALTAHQPAAGPTLRAQTRAGASGLVSELRRLLILAGERRGHLRDILHAAALSRGPLDENDFSVVAGAPQSDLDAAIGLVLERQVLCLGARPGQFRVASQAWRTAITELFADSARSVHSVLARIASARSERAYEVPHHLWRADAPGAAWTSARIAIERALAVPDFRIADELLSDVEEFGDASGALSVLEWSTVLKHRASVLIHRGRPAEAESRFAELRALDMQFSPSSPESAVTGFGWIGLAAAAEARGEYSNAVALAEGGLARHSAASPVRAELLLMLGKGRLLVGDNKAAEEGMLQAERTFDFLGQTEGQWRAWIELALMAVYRRDSQVARRWLAAADRVTALDPLLRARKQYVAGMLEEASGHPDKAMGHLRKAANELEQMGHLRGLAGALAGQAIALRRLGRFAEADQVLSTAIESRIVVGDQRGLAQTLNNLADLRVVSGRPHDAIQPALQALEIAVQLGPNIHSIFAHCTLAEAYLSLGQVDLAVQSASASLAANGDPAARPAAAVTCIGVLAEAAAGQGNHAHAYELMKRAAQLQTPCGDAPQILKE